MDARLPSTSVARPLAPAPDAATGTPRVQRLHHWRRPALERVTCLSYGGGLLAGAGGRVCCVWDTHTHVLRQRIVFAEPIAAVWVAHGGTTLALAAGQQVAVYDATGTLRFVYTHAAAVTSVHIDPSGRLLASADTAGHTDVRDMATGQLLQRITCAPGRLIVFIHRDRFVLIGAETCSLLIDATTGETLRRFPYDPREAPDHGGRLFGTTLMAFSGSVVRWFDCGTFDGPHCVRDLGSKVQSIDIDEPTGLAVAATESGALHLFDLRSGHPRARHASFTVPLLFARFGPAASLFVAGGEALVMHVVDGRHVRSYCDETPPLVAMAFARDDNALLVTHRDGGVAKVSLRDGERLWRFDGHAGSVSAVACGGNVVASGAYDGTLRLLDRQLRPTLTVDLGHGPVQAIALDVAARQVWAGTWGGRIHRVDLRTGQVVEAVDACTSSIRTLCLDATAERLCAGSDNGDLCVYDVRAGVAGRFSLRQPGAAYRALFDANGDLWTTANDGVRRYRASDPSLHPVTYPGMTIRWFDLYGDRVVSLSLAGVLTVFDLATGAVLHRTVIESPVNHRSVLVTSADRIVTASADGMVRVFDARLRQVAALELLREGTLWTTLPVDGHPGWLHTDRPDLVEVGARTDVGVCVLAENDPARTRHLAVFGSASHVMRIVRGDVAMAPHAALGSAGPAGAVVVGNRLTHAPAGT